MMKKQILLILDGWGIGEKNNGNAIYLANTPNYDYLLENYPHSHLKASGEAVGLPDGQMGNSEVGHMNIGAGRIVYQDLTRINRDIKDGSFYNNEVIKKTIQNCINNNTSLHLLGLVSHGGVHSHMDHLYSLLETCKKYKLKDVYVHGFLDGRDVSPTSGLNDIAELEEFMKREEIGEIASLAGRFYAMDRDERWDRIEKAYNIMVLGKGLETTEPKKFIKDSYEKNITDEFIEPTSIVRNHKKILINDDDSIIFFNFRPDRARELTRAFVDKDFKGFRREKTVNVYYTTMTEYDESIHNVSIIYKPVQIKNTIGEIISNNNLNQLRIAETEKYAHVTFFLNGGEEVPYQNEDRILVPSPKVQTYDMQPQMSAEEVKNHIVDAIKENKHDFIVLNFANTDMVGHTGDLKATIKAVETVDKCIGDIIKIVDENGEYDLYITADHGNSEYMIDKETDKPFTAHTTNEVYFISYPDKNIELNNGKLSDISPTILERMGIEKPKEMTGKSLIKKIKGGN